ncbi:hypothetical protein LVD15_01755 [Fulvivirga maritima]|uniref:hypothetical protein n=1 Tax=Fulvivirga maritima TaxID=2904247 RepID=UPI001F2F84E8|nr:hypothetical protein [Fulvivirga maritima]UII27176.1 hypothetical protein LVD15_01755 [Fulvivirga maritima]
MLKREFFGLIVALYTILLVVVACNNDDDNGAGDGGVTQQLSGQWNSVTVMKDGIEDDRFDQFILMITEEMEMRTSGDPDAVFPAGSFEVIDSSGPFIITCNDVEMMFALDEGDLTVNFVLSSSNTGGKIAAIEGEYEFRLHRSE